MLVSSTRCIQYKTGNSKNTFEIIGLVYFIVRRHSKVKSCFSGFG